MSHPSPFLESLLASLPFHVSGTKTLPPRPPRLLPVPRALEDRVRAALARTYPGGLYRHQAEAISAALAGHDVAVATGTASGKSLIFMAAAADQLRRDPHARILALYPMKGLIQDQVGKWAAFLEPLGESAAIIDGTIPVSERPARLRHHRVILMTPDVLHAWMMSRLGDPEVRRFLAALSLLILDEAHIYDGQFGTNMAYLMRRLEAAARCFRLIVSTATLADTYRFIATLTGRDVRVIGPESDGAAVAEKTVALLHHEGENPFEATVDLLLALATTSGGPFLAFADSRKHVELLVGTLHRRGRARSIDCDDRDEADDADADHDATADRGAGSDHDAGTDRGDSAADERGRRRSHTHDELAPAVTDPRLAQLACYGVLPYRAGYEPADREAIQRALSAGELRGVVSTSALELGLDIGDIDTVVLLTIPATMKGFWQRLGRGGRRRPGLCLLLDQDRRLDPNDDALEDFLGRPLEPNRLYLDNRYLQFANALSSAQELASLGLEVESVDGFASLPESFVEMVENEMNQTAPVDTDLLPLRARGGIDPHHEFQLRSGGERNFRVTGVQNVPMGEISISQLLREAAPGMVYYYLARPYRVWSVDLRTGQVRLGREKRYTTHPLRQQRAFPRFRGGFLQYHQGSTVFVGEVEMQISDRVLGFIEKRGNTQEEHRYGPHSPWRRTPLHDFYETTGVCWYTSDGPGLSEGAVRLLAEIFCRESGIAPGDVGVGQFCSRQHPAFCLWIPKNCDGFAIFDTTRGSLRLTSDLAARFPHFAALAAQEAERRDSRELADELEAFVIALADLEELPLAGQTPTDLRHEDNWVTVIAPGEPAVILLDSGEPLDVTVHSFFYGPKGLQYRYTTPALPKAEALPARYFQVIHGSTRMIEVNLETMDEREVG